MEQCNDTGDWHPLAEHETSEAQSSRPLTSVDIAISDAIKRFYSSLTSKNRPGFRDQDLSGKVNDICWDWAQHAETYQDSVMLRSNYFVQRMDDYVYQDPSERPPSIWFSLDVPNQFWADVDRQMQPLLERHIAELTDEAITLPVYDATNAPAERPLLLSSYSGHDVYKVLHVHYEYDRWNNEYVLSDRTYVSRVQYFIAAEKLRPEIDPFIG